MAIPYLSAIRIHDASAFERKDAAKYPEPFLPITVKRAEARAPVRVLSCALVSVV